MENTGKYFLLSSLLLFCGFASTTIANDQAPTARWDRGDAVAVGRASTEVPATPPLHGKEERDRAPDDVQIPEDPLAPDVPHGQSTAEVTAEERQTEPGRQGPGDTR